MGSKEDQFERRLGAIAHIRKLLALANNNPNANEAALARSHAERVAAKWDIDLATLTPARKGPLPTAALAAFAAAFRKQYPGVDDEDYTKRAAPREPRNDEDVGEDGDKWEY